MIVCSLIIMRFGLSLGDLRPKICLHYGIWLFMIRIELSKQQTAPVGFSYDFVWLCFNLT